MSEKWERVAALGKAAEAAKNTDAGHRVYLRAMSMLEVELGIINPNNSEVTEGYLEDIDRLIKKDETLLTEEDDG